MQNWLKSTVAATALGFALAASAWADGLSTRVNTSQLAVGDTFQLILSADGQNGAAPDLAPLQQDFEILGTSQSSQTQIINGRVSQSQSWIVTLSPRALGTITIPALTAGPLSSQPTEINVLEASALPKSQGADGISLQTMVGDGSAYVFQEIPLTVRIETELPLQRAELVPPAGDFELTQTGQDKVSQISRNGRPVNVIERSYLLRPNSEGTLTIPPFTLKGAVRDPNARRDPFSGFGSGMFNDMMGRAPFGGMGSPFDDMFNPGTPFAVRSDVINLDVLANPNASESDWFLPAKAVEIQAEWQNPDPIFKEGEATTRRISLLALGARPEQLPDITFTDPQGARIYLDDTATHLVETDQGTVAQKDFLISVVPTQGGQVTLPEIAVEWLDTSDDQMKTAVLPALTLDVEGTIPKAVVSGEPPAKLALQDTEHSSAWKILGALMAFLAAISAWFMWYRRNRKAEEVKPQASDPLTDLQTAAKQSDQMGFYKALLALRANAHSSAVVSNAIKALETAAFSSDSPKKQPDLQALMREISNEVQRASRKRFLHKRSDKLPGLYPV